MIKVGVVGVGKMGLSHLSILRAHPQVEIAAMCDSTGYLLDVLNKYTGMPPSGDYDAMLRDVDLDAVVIATPTKAHFPMVRAALERGLHVFCEKPLTLSSAQSEELADLAGAQGLYTQVGYHNRFVAAFAEAKRLLDLGAIGTVSHVLAEAYGPVVLRPKGSTWRSRRSEGGGCLYDYAAHPLDLLTWYVGEPTGVRGTVLSHIFSEATEDAVYSTIDYADGVSAQLSVNWSDESYRKMSTKITLWGTAGRIVVDRQECQVYLRDTAVVPEGYEIGWNVRYTTDLTAPVWFYVRGEEYSAELAAFVEGAMAGSANDALNSFRSAAVADRVMEMMIADATAEPAPDGALPAQPPRRRARSTARVTGRRLVARSRQLVGRTLTSLRDRRSDAA